MRIAVVIILIRKKNRWALQRASSLQSEWEHDESNIFSMQIDIKVILDPERKTVTQTSTEYLCSLSLCELPRDIMYFCFVFPAEAAARTPNNTEGAVEVAAVLGTTTAGAARDTPHHRTPTSSRKFLRDQVP
jgi:hypothetical protein